VIDKKIKNFEVLSSLSKSLFFPLDKLLISHIYLILNLPFFSTTSRLVKVDVSKRETNSKTSSKFLLHFEHLVDLIPTEFPQKIQKKYFAINVFYRFIQKWK